jgi:uncharacterized membrane protein
MLKHFLFRPRHEVNLWIVPLKMSLAAVLLFAATVSLDMLAAYHVIHLPDWFSMGGIDDARAILGAMLGCVSTVLALIFSVALLVLSMVANLFGPRLLYRFVQDWVTQTCIGLFMGAFIYVFLVFLVTHKDEHTEFIPQVSLITSWFLVLAAFAFLVFYSHRVAVLIQNPDAIGRIVDDLHRIVPQNCPKCVARSMEARAKDEARLDEYEKDHGTVPSARSGYVQIVDQERLVAAAAKADALVMMRFRPGQFVVEGEALASVSPSSALPHVAPEVERGVTMGHHRVLAQDIEFGVAQIVEIAIRALSPAINDTFTGVACVDFLGESLVLLAEAPQFDGRLYDEADVLRVQLRPVRLHRLIRQAFDQIRQASADNPAVSLRLLTTMARLAPKMEHEQDRQTLLEQADAVWESANSTTPIGLDRADLELAWQRARGALGRSV